MPHANRFRDPVVRPKVALVGIAITLAIWLLVFGCAGLVRSCGSRETSAPRSAEDRGAPAPSVPETFVVTQTSGFVQVPPGTREVKLTLRKDEWSPFVVLPPNAIFITKHKLYPIEYQTMDGETLVIEREGEMPRVKGTDQRRKLEFPDGRFRVRAPKDGELIVELDRR